MAVTPGLPRIGEQRVADYLAQVSVDIMLFHDGNQSGHVEKPVQAVDTANDVIEVNDNINDVTGDFGFLTSGQAFEITGSTGNDGSYVVGSLNFNFETERTEISVDTGKGDSVTDSTPDGSAVFGNANRSGRGDNLRDSDRLADITTEPSDGGYTRATNQSLEIAEINGDWFIRTTNDTVFDNLDATTGRVDAAAVIDNWQAQNDGSATDHLLFVTHLDQLYLLNQTTRHTINQNTLRLAIR